MEDNLGFLINMGLFCEGYINPITVQNNYPLDILDSVSKMSFSSAVKRDKVTVRSKSSDFEHALSKEIAELYQAKSIGAYDDFKDRHEGIMKSSSFENLEEEMKKSTKIFKEKYESYISGTKGDELADLILVCASYAKFLGLDLSVIIKNKLLYNAIRND